MAASAQSAIRNRKSAIQLDGFNRRIAKLVPGSDWDRTDYYYTRRWQVIEERYEEDVASANKDDPVTTLKYQYVWGRRYIDAPIVRDEDTSGDGDCIDAKTDADPAQNTGDEHLYYCQDANFNVTALVDDYDGAVVERYMYSPYGEVTVLHGDRDSSGTDTSADEWSERTSNTFENAFSYCGYYHDWETGLYHVRRRYLHAPLGRFVSRDPLGYIDGANTYEYVTSMPTVYHDPYGLAVGCKVLIENAATLAALLGEKIGRVVAQEKLGLSSEDLDTMTGNSKYNQLKRKVKKAIQEEAKRHSEAQLKIWLLARKEGAIPCYSSPRKMETESEEPDACCCRFVPDSFEVQRGNVHTLGADFTVIGTELKLTVSVDAEANNFTHNELCQEGRLCQNDTVDFWVTYTVAISGTLSLGFDEQYHYNESCAECKPVANRPPPPSNDGSEGDGNEDGYEEGGKRRRSRKGILDRLWERVAPPGQLPPWHPEVPVPGIL